MVQSYVPKFTYIIPFKFSSDRILSLKRVVEWLSGFQGVEIMIVEQDTHSKIDYLNFKATHVFLKSTIPFNKSWAYNVGIKRAMSKTIIFGDADFVMNPMELIESLKMIDSFDCIIPTDSVVKLSPSESQMDTNSIFRIDRVETKSNILDGISIFNKDAIMKIGGWNEDMIGLGFENSFQEMKMNKYLNSKQLNFKGYHLFHQPDSTPQQLQMRNKQILEVYSKDKNLIDQHVSQTLPKIGFANRFSSSVV
jgi:glycosyltransferase involved in cell wall biosynthesis